MLLAQGPSLIKRSLEGSMLHWQKGNTIHQNRLFFSLLRKRNSFKENCSVRSGSDESCLSFAGRHANSSAANSSTVSSSTVQLVYCIFSSTTINSSTNTFCGLKLHLKNLNSGKPQVLTRMPTIGGCFLAEQVFPDKDFRHGRERFVSHLSPTAQRD